MKTKLKPGQRGVARVTVPDCSDELIVTGPRSIVIGYEIYDVNGNIVHGGSCAGALNCLLMEVRDLRDNGYEINVDSSVRLEFPREYSQFEQALQVAA